MRLKQIIINNINNNNLFNNKLISKKKLNQSIKADVFTLTELSNSFWKF